MNETTHPRMSHEKFNALITNRNIVFIIMSIIFLLISIAIWNYNVWTAAIGAISGILQLIISTLMWYRIHTQENLQKMGNIVVEYSWVLLSIGIGMLALLPSSFFMIPMPWFAIAILIGLGWVLLGSYNIYSSKKIAGVQITV